MKVLFVGGTGVISTECTKLAVEKGIDIYLLNRRKTIANLPDGVNIITGDIRDADSMKKVLDNHKFDVVVDWITFTTEHAKNDYEIFRDITNQFIFISSASIYQKPIAKLPITEETPIENKFWAYSNAKIECENYFMQKHVENNFPITICRPSHTYNKTKNPLHGEYLPFHRMKNGKPIIIHDNGNSLWTLTHSKDFAKGFIGLLGKKEAIGEVYQITSDETLTWNEIAKLLAEKAGLDLKISYVPSTVIKSYDDNWGDGLLGDKAYSVKFDNSKIKKLVPEFECKIPFSEGAAEIADWFMNNKSVQIVDEKLDRLMDKIIFDFHQEKHN